ncbi:MAG TPA: ATP-grasp domain-containing protein [Rhizomicrobium sp.]|nr:ATP-grasp domain-containing protein [Rhizomicrobium sp.]
MTSRILLYATMNWPSAARYAAGFVAADAEVHAACPDNAHVRLSRYVTKTHAYRPLTPLRSLRRAIAASAPDLVVACDDRAVSHLVGLHAAEMKKSGVPSTVARIIARSLGKPENYARVVSRYGSLEEIRDRGVRVPDTLPMASETDIDHGLLALGLPVVIKSDGSWGGEGVAVARTREEAHAAWRKLAYAPSRLRSLARALRREDAHFILAALKPSAPPVCMQRFIPGRPAASAFAAYNGKIVALFHYDVLVADATIGPPNVIRRVDDAEMDKAARIVAERFQLSGLHGLDFIRDEEGKVHLIEINPRATQGGTLPFGDGRDLPAALAQTLTDRPVGRRSAIGTDVVAFFPREMRRDPASPYLREGYHDIPRDDPAVLRAVAGAGGPEQAKRIRTRRLRQVARHA